ncbi:VCBS repeat-containing protein [Longispora sp. K20-0274]|uniref:FG-GAP repeat domain-containing protein n=1 Tax=Longispora sp. K20-0274 TaxID=3088255 RepID=UPI003999B644
MNANRFLRTAVVALTALAAASVTAVLGQAPAHASTAGGSITRSEVIDRAQSWVDRGIVYSPNAPSSYSYTSGPDGGSYRQDCSGLVSMAWHLTSNPVSGEFLNGAGPNHVIAKSDLKPGDALVYSGHIELFARWGTYGGQHGAFVYSFNTQNETVQNPAANSNLGHRGFNSDNDMNQYTAIRYDRIIDDSGPGGTPTGTLADINLDGKNDVLARTGTGDLLVYPGNGTGGFLSSYKVGAGFDTMSSLSLGDFDNDGRADLLTTVAATGELKVWPHTGNASAPFSGSGEVIGSGWNVMTSINVGDINRDGKLDLVARDGSGNLWAYPGDGALGFGNRWLIGTGWNGMSTINISDVNRDGMTDLIGRTSTGDLRLYTHSGDTVSPYGAGALIGTGWSGMTAVLFGDFNGDGNPDIISRVSDNTLRMYAHSGNTSTAFYGTGGQIGTGWGGMTDLD